MAFAHSPKIVTDGLVLALDAKNPKSYPGSGATWYDLSGQGNHVTLYNSPAYSDGAITGNGTNEYGRTTNTLDLSGLSAITVVSAWKQFSTTLGAIVYEHTSNWNTGTSYGGFGIYTNSDGSNTVTSSNHHQLKGNTGYSGANAASPNTATFQQYVTVHDFSAAAGSETLAYINGEYVDDSYSNENNTGTFGDDYLYLWSRGGSSAWSRNSLAYLFMYNRALTPSEITQNHNALKGRFGL